LHPEYDLLEAVVVIVEFEVLDELSVVVDEREVEIGELSVLTDVSGLVVAVSVCESTPAAQIARRSGRTFILKVKCDEASVMEGNHCRLELDL
jgi:hypothetical protein